MVVTLRAAIKRSKNIPLFVIEKREALNGCKQTKEITHKEKIFRKKLSYLTSTGLGLVEGVAVAVAVVEGEGRAVGPFRREERPQPTRLSPDLRSGVYIKFEMHIFAPPPS